MKRLNLMLTKGEVPVLIFGRFVTVSMGSNFFCHPVFVYVSVCLCVHACEVGVCMCVFVFVCLCVCA